MLEIFVASFAGIVGVIAGHLFTRSKTKAEADLTSVKAAEAVVELYSRALLDLQNKVEALEKEIKCLKEENRQLRLQLPGTNGSNLSGK